jgi:primase-polymerase (primpol)-like protein
MITIKDIDNIPPENVIVIPPDEVSAQWGKFPPGMTAPPWRADWYYITGSKEEAKHIESFGLPALCREELSPEQVPILRNADLVLLNTNNAALVTALASVARQLRVVDVPDLTNCSKEEFTQLTKPHWERRSETAQKFLDVFGATPPSKPVEPADASEPAQDDQEREEAPVTGAESFLPELHSCVHCKLDPPDGTERALGDGNWVHPRCEAVYNAAREEGLAQESAAIANYKQPASPKPTASAPQFEHIPSELRALPNWIMWRYEPPDRPDNPKWKKVPCNLSGRRTDAANRTSDWTTLDRCQAAYQRGIAGDGPLFDGVGFCFDGEIGPDGYCLTGVDFDDCCHDNVVVLKQKDRINRLNTYTEQSPSGRGFHCIGRSLPLTLKTDDVEIYSSRRFFTFTGRGFRNIRVVDTELQTITAEVRAESKTRQKNDGAPSTHLEPNHWFDLLTSEQKDEVIDHALEVIASKTSFLELEEDGGNNDQWYRLTTAVARSGAPHAESIFVKHALKAKNHDPEDALREHFARCQNTPPPEGQGITVGTLLRLASEHGADFEQWRNCAAVRERRARQIAENIKIGDNVTEPLLPQVMTLEEMLIRLVFIGSTGAVADRRTGRIRAKQHALDEYMASKYTPITGKNAGKEGPALKFWIACKERVTVEVLAWVPGAPQICQPPEGPGPAFNMWRGLPPMAYPEDWQKRSSSISTTWCQPRESANASCSGSPTSSRNRKCCRTLRT